MAIFKFIARQPTTVTLTFVVSEFGNVQKSIDSLMFLLKALETPIEIGPADSAGVGFRTLRIPN